MPHLNHSTQVLHVIEVSRGLHFSRLESITKSRHISASRSKSAIASRVEVRLVNEGCAIFENHRVVFGRDIILLPGLVSKAS